MKIGSLWAGYKSCLQISLKYVKELTRKQLFLSLYQANTNTE